MAMEEKTKEIEKGYKKEGENEQPVMVITGGSSGIGAATKAIFEAKGYRVYDLSRRSEYACDVTQREQIDAALAKIRKESERIDVVIVNAGYGISGPIETAKSEDIKRQMEVNFLGAVNTTQAVLPILRKQGFGRILFTSSVAAILPIPYQSFYSASKAAINAFALALANEVREWDIKVAVLMPGDVKTGFTAARKKGEEDSGLYPHAKKAVEAMEKDEQRGLRPESMAQILYHMARTRSPRPQYIGGAQYRVFGILEWLLPKRWVNGIVGILYR